MIKNHAIFARSKLELKIKKKIEKTHFETEMLSEFFWALKVLLKLRNAWRHFRLKFIFQRNFRVFLKLSERNFKKTAVNPNLIFCSAITPVSVDKPCQMLHEKLNEIKLLASP